jgi:hypothetical protein
MIIEVRLLVLKIELKTALYAPSTSCVAFSERVLRPGAADFCLSAASTSASVSSGLITNHVP